MNRLVDDIRQNYNTDKSDDEILKTFVEKGRPWVEQYYPDAIADYERLKTQPLPSEEPMALSSPEPLGWGQEFTQGFKRGTKGAKSAWAGAGSLATRLVGADETAQSLGQASIELGKEAEALPGTVPSYKDIHGVRDAARYVVGGAGEVIPSLLESAAFALIGTAAGAAVGTAAAPGPGTAGGGAGGALTGFFAKGAVKRLLKKKLIENATKMEATELGIATAAEMAGTAAAKMSAAEAAKFLVKAEGKNIAMQYGAGAAGMLNSLAMNSGDIYQNMLSQGIDPDKAVNAALLGGLVSAVPDSVLPAYIAGKILKNQIKGAVTEATKKGFYGYVTRFASEAAKTIPWEGGTEGFQEWVSILAERYAKGEQPMFSDLSEQDKERVINAGALGAIGGLIAAPVAVIPSKGGETDAKEEKQKEKGGDVLNPPGAPPGTPAPTGPVVGTDISDVAAKYELTPEEIAKLKKQREELVAAHPELATPPADTPEQDAVVAAAAKTDPDPTQQSKAGVNLGRVSLDPTKVREYMDSGMSKEEAIAKAASETEVTTTPAATPINETPEPPPPAPAPAPPPPSPNAAIIAEASSEAVPPVEAVVPEPPTVAQTEAAPFNSDEFIGTIDWPSSEGAGKQTVQAAPGMTSGKGKQSSMAFEESSKTADAFKDSTVPGRKLGLFMASDGSHGLIASLNGADPRSKRVATPDGGMGIARFLKSGYQLVGSVKLKVPLAGFSTKVEPAQFQNALVSLRNKQAETRNEFSEGVLLEPPNAIVVTGNVGPAKIVEPFTPDEGNALWKVIGHLKPEEIESNLYKAGDLETVNALTKILVEFTKAYSDITPIEAATLITQYVKDAIAIARGNKGEFVKSIVRAVNAITGRPAGEAQAAQSEILKKQADARAKLAGKQKGGAAKESGPGTGGGTQPGIEGKPGVRFQGSQSVPDWRLKTPDIKRRMLAAFEGMEASGWSVTTIGEELNGHVQEFGGYTDPAARTIVVFVSDQSAPSKGNLITTFHEAFDAVMSQESPEMQEMAHLAVKDISDEAMGITDFSPKISPLWSSSEAEVIQSHERLSESVARKLEARGFDPAEARGLWNAVLRWLRDKWYRVALAIQKAAFGPEHVNMQTAEAYFTNRLMSLLAGDTGNYSFASWLVGRKQTGGEVANTFAKSTGLDELGQWFDPNTGEMVYAEVHEDSESAVKFNNLIRYQGTGKKLSKVTDELVETGREPGQNYTAQAEEKIAAQNAIKAGAMADYAAWNSAGLNNAGATFQQWLDSKNFTSIADPEKLKAEQQAGLANSAATGATGAAPANMDVLISDLPPHQQSRAANIAFKSTLDDKNRREDRIKSDAAQFAPLNAELQKNVQRLSGIVSKFQDLDYMGDVSMDINKEMIDEMGRDMKDVKQRVGKFGVLSQTVEELEGKMDDKLAKDYASAMQRNYKRWRSSTEASRNFANTLRAAAETSVTAIINWSTDSPTLIKTKLLDMARTTPELSHLLEPSMDRRAEMAMIVAFGKKHFEMVTFLSMQKRSTEAERKAVADTIKLAMGTHKAAGQEARLAAAAAGRYNFQAGRLVDVITRMKAENRSLLDDIVRKESFAEFYYATKGTINNRLNELGRIIGAQSEAWENYHGATANIPRTNNEPEDQWEKVKMEHKLDGTPPLVIVGWIKRIRDRLDSKPKDSWSVQERALDVIGRKMSIDAYNMLFKPMRGNIVTRMIGSITDKLASTGHPAAISAATKIRLIDAFANIGKRDQEILGAAWSKYEGRMMTEAKRILNRKFDLQSFRDLVYNPMGKYFENRGDFWSGSADKATAKRNATAGLREHFRLSDDTEDLANDPKFWSVMQDSIDQTERNIDFLISAGKLMGRKIEDMGYFRDIIGATLNYMPRKWRRTTKGIFNEMQKNWDGTKNDKLDGKWVAEEYASDPATLKAKVASRLTPSLWSGFVRAIVEKTGRSSFYSPQEGTVRTLALRNNLIQAFEAANPLDLVGFAENLHDMESASLTGQPLMDKSEYVAEVLGTFQNFYQILHNEYADKENSVNHGLPTPNAIMMDARVSNEAPSSWLEYLPLDGQTMRLAVRSMAFEFGGGKNLEAIRLNFNQAENELSSLDSAYNEMRNKLRATGLSGSSLRQAMLMEAELKGGKGHLIRMEQASRNARLIGSMKRAFDSMVKMQLDIPMELRTWIELIGTVAGMTVQGLGTALTDLSYMFIQPFRNYGLNKEAVEMVYGHASKTAKGMMGSMALAFGKQINLDTDLNNAFHEMGWDDSDGTLSLKDKFTELTHEQLFLTDPDGKTVLSRFALRGQRGIKLASRGMRQLLGTGFTGFQRTDPNRFNYPTLKLFSPFTMVSQLQHLSTSTQMWDFVIPRVVKAMEFYNANPAEFNDPSFRLTAKHIGMSEQAFNYQQASMGGYGMSFEMLAKDAMRRRAADPMAEILTPENRRSLGQLGTTETVMESGMTTRMPSFLTNPWLAAASPLASWAVQASNVLGKRADPIIQADGGKATAKATWNMLLPYAAMLPIGIGFALFREWFDEHFQGKKANVQGFGQNNDFLAAVEKACRTSVFGMAGDVVNSMVNTDTNRPFSVDSRVLFLSSIFGFARATSTWLKQGSFDYQSVGRPYISAMGGSGFLQNIDVLNHAMTVYGLPPLIEAEAKQVAKMSVQNYLRTGGRSLGMDVRTGTFGAQSGLTNPAKPYVGQMLLSSYANDPQGFMEANRRAVIERMRDKKVSYDDAKDYVKRSYQGMNPITTVFLTQPTEAEFMRLVVGLPEHGKIAVMTALRNYNYYGNLLGLEPSYGRKPEKPKSINRMIQLPRIQDVRRQAMAY